MASHGTGLTHAHSELATGGGNVALAAVCMAVLFGILGVLAFLMLKANSSAKEEEEKAKREKGSATGSRRRGALERMQRGAARAATGGGGQADDEEDDDGDDGGRNAQREQKKQERRAQQQYERQVREQQTSAKTEKQSKYNQRQQEKDAERLKLEEEEKKAREEKERKEQEEFSKWKEMFAVEAEGQDDAASGGESVVDKFLDYVKVRKVVNLEDLSAEFRMRTSSAIDRLQQLEKLGRLNGIFDDRGKYIYITAEEQAAVAEWLKKKGRISRADLVAACNRIIRLNPTDEDKAKLEEEARNVAEALEGETDVAAA